MPPFRIEYFCPRELPGVWQALKEGLIFKTPSLFWSLDSAVAQCNGLIWRYHAARVLDATGNVLYQI
jgi:hypothetical protein